jgi:hypothetical protein
MRTPIALFLTLCLTGFAAAQTLTSKERLSDKASDNQRLDNCGVAPERRGAEPRPGCPGTQTSSASGDRPAPPRK